MSQRARPTDFSRLARGPVVILAALAAFAVLFGACSQTVPPEGTAGGSRDGSAVDICATPHAGCPCSSPGQVADCGYVESRSGDYVTCEMGKIACDASGHWGQCIADHAVFKSAAPMTLSLDTGRIHTTNYGTPSPCPVDPCDPSCTQIPDDGTGVDAGVGFTLTDAGGLTLLPDAPPPDAVVSCTGIQCQVNYGCAPGQSPKITGKVYDPASLNPIFNAIVMIPNAAVPPIPPGVSSDPCGGAQLPPAVDYAFTTYDGSFTLNTVPIGNSVPLLIQIGRWRRIVNIDTHTLTCGSTLNLSANCGTGNTACITRLPRVQSEGNIPQIAMVASRLDAMECLLYRIGVSSSEFTDELGTGRVHYFRQSGSSLPGGANHDVSYLMGFTCGTGRCPAAGAATCGAVTPVSNGGFEAGNLSNWTASGASAVATNSTAHSGTWSALLGKTTPTNGDSSITQSFTAPAGANTLSFWYKMSCPDGVQWDWATANLQDTTAGTTTTILPNTCVTNAWTQVTAPVVAGHNYTLTLTSHDDNWSSDPSYTYFDDIGFASCTPPPPPPNLLPNYDLVVLPCDGGDEYASGLWGASANEPGRVNLVNYANVGGRIFTSHWAREWIERPGPTLTTGPFPNVATWYAVAQQPSPANACAQYGCNNNNTGFFDTSFQRGTNFAAWMGITAGSGTQMSVTQARYDVQSVNAATSKRFVYAWGDGNPPGHPGAPDTVFDMTFDTPVGGTATGRVMFTDMHLANGTPSGSFPSNCPAQGTALTQQEKAAEYLLFDLSACVNKQPPPTTVTWYNGATISRQYQNNCPAPKHVAWRFFYWKDIIPTVDSGTPANIVFTVQTAATPAGLATAQIANLATVNTTNLSFVGADVGAALATIPMKSQDWLQVNITLNPSSDHSTAPILTAWQLTFDCVDAE